MATTKKTSTTATKSPEVIVQAPKKLTRSSVDRMIFGVCGGIAEYLAIDAVIIRFVFVILMLSGGSGVLLYIILAIIVPEKDSADKSAKEVMQENGKNFEKTMEDVASNVETVVKQKNTQTWLGIGIVGIGILLLASNFGFVEFQDVIRLFVRTLWPLAIIVAGFLILSKSNHGK